MPVHSQLPALPPPAAYLNGPRAWAFLCSLMLVHMLCQIDRILPFILAESIKRELGLSDTQLGLINGVAFSICFTLMAMPLARAADHGSPRRVLILCVLGWSTMTALGGWAATALLLAVTRFGVAFGEAGAIPAGHAMIARSIRPERRGMAIGLYSMGIPLGAMLGFAGGGALNDLYGWRTVLLSAGACGLGVILLVLLTTPRTPPQPQMDPSGQSYFRASLQLAITPYFRWLMAGAVAVGFAAAPFYAFAAPFLIRTHGYTSTEVGLTFGLLQGGMGIVGTLIGGRGFDRAVRSGTHRLLTPPAILFLLAACTTTAALFAPVGWLSIALMVPGMLSFAFLFPWAFGASHAVAGHGREAQASGLVMMGSGLLGPTLGPLLVGLISDGASAAQIPNGLGLGLLVVPLASLATGLTLLVANRRVAAELASREH